MDLLYRILVYIHVSSVILSIGPFFILLPIVKKLHSSREQEINAYLSTFQSVVRLAKHTGHVLVITGILLVMCGPWTWTTPWIIMTLIFLFLLIVLSRLVRFHQHFRKYNEEGQDKKELATKLKRSIWIYIILLMTMLWFMVGKPTFGEISPICRH